MSPDVDRLIVEAQNTCEGSTIAVRGLSVATMNVMVVLEPGWKMVPLDQCLPVVRRLLCRCFGCTFKRFLCHGCCQDFDLMMNCCPSPSLTYMSMLETSDARDLQKLLNCENVECVKACWRVRNTKYDATLWGESLLPLSSLAPTSTAMHSLGPRFRCSRNIMPS